MSPLRKLMARFGAWGYALLAVAFVVTFQLWLLLSNAMRGAGFSTIVLIFGLVWLVWDKRPFNRIETIVFRSLVLVALFFFPGVFLAGGLRLAVVGGIGVVWFLFHPVGEKQ